MTTPGLTLPGPATVTTGSDLASVPNDVRVAGIAQASGWSGTDLTVAVAVALAESGGQFNASHVNTSGKGTDWGLWQINDHYHTVTQDVKTNGLANGRAAYAIYKAAGSSFKPWATYNSGAFRKYTTQAQKAIVAWQALPADRKGALLGSSQTSAIVPNPSLNPLDGVGGWVTQATETFRVAADHLVAILIALVLIVLGVVILVKSELVGGTVKQLTSAVGGKAKR